MAIVDSHTHVAPSWYEPIETLLFDVRPRDPLTLAMASTAILAISPAAIWLPLRRATQVDCTVALREE